jgi:hypothetical protein
MQDELSLKWGKMKSWSLRSGPARVAGQKYIDLAKAIKWEDWDGSDAQKQCLCEIIDAVNCDITNDWNGSVISKADAKRYVMMETQPFA